MFRRCLRAACGGLSTREGIWDKDGEPPRDPLELSRRAVLELVDLMELLAKALSWVLAMELRVFSEKRSRRLVGTWGFWGVAEEAGLGA